jgi:hypothetical protein
VVRGGQPPSAPVSDSLEGPIVYRPLVA